VGWSWWSGRERRGIRDRGKACDRGNACDRQLRRVVSPNHCGSTTHAVDPSPCVQYDGCDAADPLIWCSVPNEGHAIPSFGASAIANFFMQF